MDKAKNIRKGEDLNWQQLEDYLRTELPELIGKMTVGQFHGGHANLTYLVKFGDTELVVRRPPFGKIAPGAHDMKREYRVLSKLYQHFSPAPRAYHLCEDEDIIGAKFVVIERRHGVIMRYELLDCFKDFDKAEERLTSAMINAQATLHTIDYKAADLTKLGRPEGFLERQLAGWSKRWALSKIEENKEMEEVMTRLQATVPTMQAVSIIHNDIKFDNCQFQADNPDEVTSIFDWDMCTLGDPLVDFASTLSYWPDDFFLNFDLPVMMSGNFPKKEFLMETYAKHTGFSLDQLPWYEAFAYWKGAVISQQLYRRYVNGATKDKRMERFGKVADAYGQLAIHILEGKR